MSHGVHAVQHEVEHQIEHEEHGHGGGGHGAKPAENHNKKIALLIAVIALFLAFSETLGKSAQTAALSYNVEASNLWAFYQAKTIRQTTLSGHDGAAQARAHEDRRRLVQRCAQESDRPTRIDNWTRTTARYESGTHGPTGGQRCQPEPALWRGTARTVSARTRGPGQARHRAWSVITITRSLPQPTRSASCSRQRR